MQKPRPPIIVVLGHVDHGKTTLLDKIRKTSHAAREAGGITQGIGASTVTTKENKKITFIDTPGHVLFSNMRSRGARLADIAILVVAADDGVAPQTKESLTLLQETGTPFVVAVTKVDLPTANIEGVLGQLEKLGVFFEKRGGDVPYLEVSAKTGKGITELLDLLSLFAEVHDIKADESADLNAIVIETSKDKKGLLTSVVVKDGKIKVGDTIFSNETSCKVRGLFDWEGKPTKEIQPGEPAQILGFSQLPKIGSEVSSKKLEDLPKVELEKKDIPQGKINIYLKAKTEGALEALIANVPPEITVVGSSVGDVIESDVFFAKAANAVIFVFESKAASSIKKLAQTEGIRIESFNIVYSLIERLNEIIKSGLEEILGQAQVVAIFPFNNKKIAGCKILQGKIQKTDSLKLTRNGKEIGKVKVASLRRGKEEIKEAKTGEECGILFEPQLEIAVGDVLLSVAIK